ncbi:MAG: 30S ribosomal protein S3, partial [Ginsengibacter sp.]
VYGKIGVKVWICKGEVLAKRDLNPNIVAGGGKSDNDMQQGDRRGGFGDRRGGGGDRGDRRGGGGGDRRGGGGAQRGGRR